VEKSRGQSVDPGSYQDFDKKSRWSIRPSVYGSIRKLLAQIKRFHIGIGSDRGAGVYGSAEVLPVDINQLSCRINI